ncbi:hypothetical protein EMIHUDRAFT_353403, partial [Emiliania huxleyi CCMP1516]|uniref:AP2/ERF domain-containing protein n=2 Tax=Emiliania huxleyi TaxID=2903 RepID=A0A0D3JXZ5_EMIH1
MAPLRLPLDPPPPPCILPQKGTAAIPELLLPPPYPPSPPTMDDRAIGGAWHKPTVERTAEAARNAAAAEGLTLVRGGTGASGFLCVVASKGLYKATFMREDKRIHLGTFECAEAASLAVARNFPEVLAEASAKAAAKAAKETRPGLSLKDVERTAAA